MLKTATLVYKFLHRIVLLTISDHPCLCAAAPAVPDVVNLTVNVSQFLISTPHPRSQSNTLVIALPLMLLRLGMTFLTMYAVQHLLPL